jgi:hypothetical protein
MITGAPPGTRTPNPRIKSPLITGQAGPMSIKGSNSSQCFRTHPSTLPTDSAQYQPFRTSPHRAHQRPRVDKREFDGDNLERYAHRRLDAGVANSQFRGSLTGRIHHRDRLWCMPTARRFPGRSRESPVTAGGAHAGAPPTATPGRILRPTVRHRRPLRQAARQRRVRGRRSDGRPTVQRRSPPTSPTRRARSTRSGPPCPPRR